MLKQLFGIGAFTLLLTLTPSLEQTYAQTTGLSLTPPAINERADPGEVVSSAVTLENQSDQRETYYLFSRDIEGTTDTGRPLYATDDFVPTELNISSWIVLTRTEVALEPGEKVSVPFVITVPENAPPGGHFAGVFGSLRPPEQNTFGVGVGVGYRVGNIINLRVSGDVVEDANIRAFQTDAYVYGKKDVTFTARVENLGNVLLRPSGPLTITNMLGDEVAQLTMNEGRAGVFPKSMNADPDAAVRSLTTTWSEAGLGFGYYKAAVALVYGIPGEAQYTMSAETGFWVLPWEIIRPLLISLAIFAVASYVLVRYYINQQVRRLSGGRRLVRTVGAGPSPLLMAAIIMLFVTALVIFVVLMLFA